MVASTAPQASCPSTMIKGVLSTCTAYSRLATISSLAKLPATRQTKRSPRAVSKQSSGAIRESAKACGAVDATIKSVRDGSTLPGHLPSLVAALKPAVDAVQGQSGDLLTNAIKRNVTLNVDQLKNAAPILGAFAATVAPQRS